MKSRPLTCAELLLVLLSALLLQMCGSNPSEPEDRQQPLDLTGSWELTTTIISNTCGLPDSTTQTETFILAESGDVWSMTTSGGPWGIAQLDGQELYLHGSETSAELGHTAVFETEGSGSASETEIIGTLITAVNFKPGSPAHTDCEITASFVMTKLQESARPARAFSGDPEDFDGM
jgi:hypothetical protein